MHLKSLTISSHEKIIRHIPFHLGSNFIIDETEITNHKATGNNIGKTTVLALIDYCLGGDAEQIYIDPETGREITFVKNFLIENDVLITLVLKENLSIENSPEVILKRNFLLRKKKIMSVDGNNLVSNKGKDYLNRLSEKLLNLDNIESPSFRQIIAHNIRYKDFKINNTLKVLNHFSTPFQYETLYLFMFGLPQEDRSQYNTKIKNENKFKKRLEKNLTKNDAIFQRELISNAIIKLENQKLKFTNNPILEEDLIKINSIKQEITFLNDKLNDLELRKEILIETENDLKNDISIIEFKELNDIYHSTKQELSNLTKTFDDLVKYHNNMIIEKIRFITQDIPLIDEQIKTMTNKISILVREQQHLSNKLAHSSSIKDIERIVDQLSKEYKKLGELTSFLEQIELADKNIEELNSQLRLVDGNRFSTEFKQTLSQILIEFNTLFSTVSDELYGEKYGISYNIKLDDKTKQNYYHFECFNANSSSGKKQGEILCFDLAYILFAEKKDIPHLKFLLNDKKELMHGNQLKIVHNFAQENNIQLIFPILKDKLPTDLNIDEYSILKLSDSNKLFKIENFK